MTRPRAGGITGSRPAIAVALLALALLLFVPVLGNDYVNSLFRRILMYGAMAYGWNLIGGYTGYVSFGNVVFFGIGCYTAAMLATHGLTDIVLSIVAAMVVSAAFAVVLGLPVLRLQGHYFGIATLSIALAVQDIIANIDAFGGSSGLSPKAATLFGAAVPYVVTYYAMWVVCLGSLLATYFIARSRLGYAFVAIRENEDAAAVLGINPTRIKVTAWAFSAMMGGAAGAVFIYANSYIDPATALAIDNNVFPIVMTLLGGGGTVAGPLLGAFVLTGINETLWNQFPFIHTLFFGAVIVFVVTLLPRGLLILLSARRNWRRYLHDLGAYRV
ncbi:MAG: branched-chain amino acid ABC transporter permease [Candidatus Eremiobacteraeota bacterium]|nr:branched-chain amino acid ABC transporter permease [Candidatus Eremiobacteraeota bacterium]MBV8355026.1 branched-chain amino acid ABC transporter permease [Candidatus Eremiobacteraeota bacterium]